MDVTITNEKKTARSLLREPLISISPPHTGSLLSRHYSISPQQDARKYHTNDIDYILILI